jgi:hypothetical protein
METILPIPDKISLNFILSGGTNNLFFITPFCFIPYDLPLCFISGPAAVKIRRMPASVTQATFCPGSFFTR